MQMGVIYVLCDPRKEQPKERDRYIGKTTATRRMSEATKLRHKNRKSI